MLSIPVGLARELARERQLTGSWISDGQIWEAIKQSLVLDEKLVLQLPGGRALLEDIYADGLCHNNAGKVVHPREHVTYQTRYRFPSTKWVPVEVVCSDGTVYFDHAKEAWRIRGTTPDFFTAVAAARAACSTRGTEADEKYAEILALKTQDAQVEVPC